MFDVPVVTKIAIREWYTELIDFLEKNKEDYAHFILTGETANK